MIIVGNKETTKIIDDNIEYKYEISKELLMENVGFRLLEYINTNHETYLVVCGFGNNGGDGYVLARLLNTLGKDVIIFKIENENYTTECSINMNRCKKLKIPIIKDIKELDFYLQKVDIVIDAIFGVGLDKELNSNITTVIKKINYYKSIQNYIIYSIDVPSGLNDEGNIYNACIIADKTLSIMTYKKAFLNYNSLKYTGNIRVIDKIVIPNNLLNDYSNIYLIIKSDIKEMEIKRKIDTNKSDYGKLYLICGSKKYEGAGYLATSAAVKTGCGYTYILSDINGVINRIPEAIKVGEIEELKNATTIAMGSGVDFNDDLYQIFEEHKKNKNFILDAGAINSKLNFENSKNVLITPHTGEFSKLSGYSLEEINKDPIRCILSYSQNHNINILLKGKNTYITDGSNIYVIDTGNPYMANAGMGDVLTGIISSLSTQGYDLISAAIIGAYLHGYIADKLKEKQYIINATDILNNISEYLSELFK